MVGGAFAQSNLPPCADGVFGIFSNPANWSNCFGSTSALGDKFKGDSYVGEFKEGKFHGQGKYIHLNGNIYIGEHKNGKRDGQGTFTIPSGAKYVGEFKDGKPNGQGIDTSANGNKYVGNFKDGKTDGQGTYFHLADGQGKGDKYVGEHMDGKRSGQGAYIRANGNVLIAEFSDGFPNGRFIEYKPDGVVYRSGIYEKNLLVREEYVSPTIFNRIPPDTHPVVANFQRIENERQKTEEKVQPYLVQQQSLNPNSQSSFPDCQGSDVSRWSNCIGTATGKNDYKYAGQWKNGNKDGFGTIYYPSGKAKFSGEFKNDEINGKGTEYSLIGSVIADGIWANGKYVELNSYQQATAPTTELEKLRSEAELERKRRQELEEQLRLAQQQPQTSTQTSTAPSIGRRVALVVGNANYKVRPLKNPRNDADDISRSLRASGFEVIDLRDASLQQMRNGVRQFGDRLINNDVGLVYYSGHGVEVKGRNYFIPVNADIMREDEIADQGLDVSLILEKMNTAGKGVNILIVDACRDDPFGRSFRSSSRGLAQMDAPRGTIIAYATSPGKVASDGDPRERNSPYTKNLIKAMQQPNKPIEQVFKEVRRAVQEETKNQQTPWENTSLSGDFYFKVQR